MNKTNIKFGHKWNLKLLYKSPTDSQIEEDFKSLEKLCKDFSKKYDTSEKKYLVDENLLREALHDLESIIAIAAAKPALYFHYLRDIDSNNPIAGSQMALMENRLAKCDNEIAFFKISLATIKAQTRINFLNSDKLSEYRFMLKCIFDDAKYSLSLAEEKILSLKNLPAYSMWVSGNEKSLNARSVLWKGKIMPFAQASSVVQYLQKPKDRYQLSENIAKVLKDVSPLSEAEINAIVTNKKIDDELRGFKTPFESTVLKYRNDPKVVEALVKAVTESFNVSHRFYRLKAKLLHLKRLRYPDRVAKIGEIKAKFSFDRSADLLLEIFESLNPKYSKCLNNFIKNGQIDAFPKIGKRSGAYCSSSFANPTFILLNHTNDLNSFKTFAHEMGHAFHFELSEACGPIYSEVSVSLAETASTLFESIAKNAVYEGLSEKEKIIFLHDKINDDISTIFRQIACFNFEADLHSAIREKGFIANAEIVALHNKNMSAYLGPIVEMKEQDGYNYVYWNHIRNFFYVYTYAYGMLVSKALLRKFKADKSFWSSIEKFLSAGGKDTPENILADIGLDLHSPDFWKEGIHEIEEDIAKLERLTQKK